MESLRNAKTSYLPTTNACNSSLLVSTLSLPHGSCSTVREDDIWMFHEGPSASWRDACSLLELSLPRYPHVSWTPPGLEHAPSLVPPRCWDACQLLSSATRAMALWGWEDPWAVSQQNWLWVHVQLSDSRSPTYLLWSIILPGIKGRLCPPQVAFKSFLLILSLQSAGYF